MKVRSGFFLGMLIGIGTIGGVLIPWDAAAGVFDFSLGFSFTRRNYSESDYNWNKRFGGSIGYHFTAVSGIELAFQDVIDRTEIDGLENTTFHDRIFSLNWIQQLTPSSFPLQPYLKLGIGQLNRDASGYYETGQAPPPRLDQVTVVTAAGMRIYLTRRFAIRAEVTSYLTGSNFNAYTHSFGDNLATDLGISVRF